MKAEHGAGAIGALAAPDSTLEELHLLGKLVRGLGSDNIDFRLRQSDFRRTAQRSGAPWLGMKIADINTLDRVLLVGSFLRKDQPLLVDAPAPGDQARLPAVAWCMRVDDDLLMHVAHKHHRRGPADGCSALAEIAVAIAGLSAPRRRCGGVTAGASRAGDRRGACVKGERKAILLGNAAVQHPQAAQLRAWAQWIAQATGASLGVAGRGGQQRSAATWSAQLPGRWRAERARDVRAAAPGLPAVELSSPSTTPPIRQPPRRRSAQAAHGDRVLAVSATARWNTPTPSCRSPRSRETAGTFVNCEGRAQSFNGAVRPARRRASRMEGAARARQPAAASTGFDYETPEAVRAEALPADAARRGCRTRLACAPEASPAHRRRRPNASPTCRSTSATRSCAARRRCRRPRTRAPPRARANARTLDRFGVVAGDKVRGCGRARRCSALLEVALDDRLPDAVVRVPAATQSIATLGSMFGPITLERG